jgi:nitroimidazol reductase NimA-like FMN-containing flavoprotein (pyridoxamine 5'-phosphate oxidase superfamily)
MDDEIRRKILKLLDEHRIMTVATLRADGWPQATTVGYVNEG